VIKKFVYLMIVIAAAVLMPGAKSQTAAQSTPSSASSPQPVRSIGVVTQIQQGSFNLHTDAGSDLMVQLPEGVTAVRVPPGSKDLKTATKISVSDISSGDRVLVRGRASEDQKSITAQSIIVMSKTDLVTAREAERLEWQRRGVSGLVKAVNPDAKEITISVPNTPPTPGNPTHPVTLTMSSNVTLLRYAPDSVKFSDAKPSTFKEIKVGDQIRALGAKNEDGSHFTAEKLISGTFRNIGATVVSVDAPNGSVTVKDLITGKSVLVRTNPDSKMHTLPPFIAQMIARFNSGGGAEGGAPGRPQGGGPAGDSTGSALAGDRPANRSGGGMGGGMGGGQGRGPGSGFGGGAPRDFNQMLDRTPALKLDQLQPGEALIVVSTEGAKPAEVTAIVLLAGVEPILASQPKGGNQMVLGQWNMGMGGGGEGGGEGGP
jgi:hypothetical protein